MKIRRAGRTVDLMLPAQTVPTSSWIVRIALQIIIPNIFLLTGLVVFLLKPNDKQALLLALMFGMEVCGLVVLIEHPDHDTEEGRDDRHTSDYSGELPMSLNAGAIKYRWYQQDTADVS